MNEKDSFTPEEMSIIDQHDLEFDVVPLNIEARFALLDATGDLDNDLGTVPLAIEDEFLALEARQPDTEGDFRMLDETQRLGLEEAHDIANRCEIVGRAMAKHILQLDEETAAQGQARPDGYVLNQRTTKYVLDRALDLQSLRLATIAAARSDGIDTDIVFAKLTNE